MVVEVVGSGVRGERLADDVADLPMLKTGNGDRCAGNRPFEHHCRWLTTAQLGLLSCICTLFGLCQLDPFGNADGEQSLPPPGTSGLPQILLDRIKIDPFEI